MRLLFLSLLGLWWVTPAWAQVPLNDQLQQAVDTEDWDNAISILDDLIEAEKQDKADLEEFRQFLIEQKAGESSDPVTETPLISTDPLPPRAPTLEEAKSTLFTICMDEITTIDHAGAELFCRCTIEELQQRVDLMALIETPDDPTLVSTEDAEQIYQACR